MASLRVLHPHSLKEEESVKVVHLMGTERGGGEGEGGQRPDAAPHEPQTHLHDFTGRNLHKQGLTRARARAIGPICK